MPSLRSNFEDRMLVISWPDLCECKYQRLTQRWRVKGVNEDLLLCLRLNLQQIMQMQPPSMAMRWKQKWPIKKRPNQKT